MEGSSASRVSKTQRETHSEIERKRRERMKRDTEFLRKQLANSQCKDKLSIFQAGAERLIQYTDKLGERDYIINDEEYSRIILSNFAGFSMHIRCSDGKVLDASANIEKILDLTVKHIVGNRIQDLTEPSSCTKQLINDIFQCSDCQWDVVNGLASRNFILPLRCGPKVTASHCVFGANGDRYRFIEFCGDLSHQNDESNPDTSTVIFRGLCRPHDPVGSTVQNNPTVGKCTDYDDTQHFTLRLSPNGFLIVEVVGACETILGCAADNLLRMPFRDVCLPSDQDLAEQLLSEVQIRSPVTGSLHLIHRATGQSVRFDIRLSAIRLGSYFHCVVCRLNIPQFEKMVEPATEKVSKCVKSAQSSGATFSRPDSLDSKNPEFIPSPIHSHSLCFRDPGTIVGQQPFPMHNITDAATSESALSDRTCPTKDLLLGSVTHNTGSEHADDWFRHVDTSSFQSLLNTSDTPPTDGY